MSIKKIISNFIINSIIGLILFAYLFFSQVGESPAIVENWFLILQVLIGSNIVGFVIFAINILLNKIPFWKRKIGLRFIFGLIVNYAVLLIFIYLVVLIINKLTDFRQSMHLLFEEFEEVVVRIYILSFVLVILLVVSDFLIYSYKYYSQGQIKTARLNREQVELKFEALRTQLSPHYLFNSLNTISSLIYKDEKLTENYIRNLASTYKYILESDKLSLIELKKEIQFIKDYCSLLDIRFGKSFKVNFDVFKSSEKLLIPPISIQILIENAVKHNVFDDETPLLVDVYTTNNSIVVSNEILKTPSNRESFRIGLGNIRKRYEVFTDKKIKITQNKLFMVELPLLKREING